MPDDALDINAGLQTRTVGVPVKAPAEGRTLHGYAVRWNAWTSIAGGAFLERFAPGSWDDSIRAATDIKVLAEHGMDPTIGLKPIATLRSLTDDGTGAAYEAELLDAPYVDELLPGLRAGLYGSSFRFTVPEGGQTINRRPGKSTHNPAGVPEVTVTRANVVELGPTSIPAYAGSTASLRSIDATPPAEPSRPAPSTEGNRHVMPKSVEELVAEAAGLRSRIQEIASEYEGRAFSAEAKTEVEELRSQLAANTELTDELRSRQAMLDEIAGKPEHVEHERTVPQIRRSNVARGEDIFDVSSIRSAAFGGGVDRELRERALRAVEISGLGDQQRSRLEGLIEADPAGYGAHILLTGSPAYRSGFAKLVTGRGDARTTDELRAMSLTGAAGGFATLPYVLDPSLVKTGNLAINPLRGISKIVQIVGTGKWRGITVGAVVASYDAEASVVSDDAPTFAQPEISTFPARAFVPFSYEVGEDYNGSLLSDLGDLISDAKDTLEANKFVLGAGTGEPAGVVTGATVTVDTAGIGAFARGDLDTLDNALPSRYQANARIIGNRGILGRIRAFDTTNGNTLYGPNAQLGVATGTEARVSMTPLGIPAYQVTDMVNSVAANSKILIEGDFASFVIVDRIGLQVEYIQNLFDPATGRPTGQRGVMAHWRSGSGVINAQAFRTLNVRAV